MKLIPAIILSLCMTGYVCAAQTMKVNAKSKDPIIMNWYSSGPQDFVSVFPASQTDRFQIIVLKSSGMQENTGIIINNCQYKAFPPGSMGFCTAIDPNRPITFSAESTQGSSGTVSLVK